MIPYLNDSKFVYEKLSDEVFMEKKISAKPEELISIIENELLSAFSYTAKYPRLEKTDLLSKPFTSEELNLVSFIDTAMHGKLGDTTNTCVQWNDYTITKEVVAEEVDGDSSYKVWNLGIIWGTMKNGEFKKVKKGGEIISFRHPTLTVMKEISDRVFPLSGGTIISTVGGFEIEIYGRIKEIL